MELLSTREAARELGIAERTLRAAVNNGELAGYRFGKRTVRVERAELYDWIRSKRIPTWRGTHAEA